MLRRMRATVAHTAGPRDKVTSVCQHPTWPRTCCHPCPRAHSEDLDTRLLCARSVASRPKLLLTNILRSSRLQVPHGHPPLPFHSHRFTQALARCSQKEEAAKGWKLGDAVNLYGALMPRSVLPDISDAANQAASGNVWASRSLAAAQKQATFFVSLSLSWNRYVQLSYKQFSG